MYRYVYFYTSLTIHKSRDTIKTDFQFPVSLNIYWKASHISTQKLFSFLFTVVQCWMYKHRSLSQFLVDGHWVFAVLIHKQCCSEQLCTYVFLYFASISLEQIPRSGIAGSKGKYIHHFARYCQVFFHQGCVILLYLLNYSLNIEYVVKLWNFSQCDISVQF